LSYTMPSPPRAPLFPYTTLFRSRTGIELVEGPCVRQMDKRRRVRASSESVPQGRGAGVVLAEWGEAQDSFDGAQHGRGRVERAVDSITASVRGRDQENRAVRVHVVGAILRVVFEDEDGER